MRRMLFATAAVLGLFAAGANAETSHMGGTAETSAGHFLQVAQDALLADGKHGGAGGA